MNLAIVFLVSFLGGLGGLLLTAGIANLCVGWYRITKREGAAGYFVVFTSLGGGVAGLIVSFITALIVALNFGPSFQRELGAAVCVILPIAAVVTVVCRLLAHIPPTIDGRELNLEVEFRFPAGTASPPTAEGPMVGANSIRWCRAIHIVSLLPAKSIPPPRGSKTAGGSCPQKCICLRSAANGS